MRHLLALIALLQGTAFGLSGDQEQAKSPIPDKATRDKIAGQLKGIFRAEYSKVRPEFTRRLLSTASETDNTDQRFVMLTEARDLAAAAGDLDTAFESIDRIVKRYDVRSAGPEWSATAQKVAALAKARKAARTREAVAALAGAYLAVAREGMEAGHYEAASDAAKNAGSVARSTGDRALADEAKALGKKITALEKEFKGVQAAELKLSVNPDDPEANLKIGRFYCFVKGDWDAGLSCLIKGSDSGLKAVAEKELAKPSDANKQAALGEAWFALSKKERDPLCRQRYQERARKWLEQALEGVSGLLKIKVDRRLEEIAKLESARTGSSSATARLPLALRRGLVLHYSFNRNEGEKVTDLSGNRNHGKVEGATWVNNARGAGNGAYALDGVDDQITLPVTAVGKWKTLSLSVWVKAPPYAGKRWPGFIAGYTLNSSRNISIGLSQDSGSLWVEVDTDQGNFAIHGGGNRVPWNHWFHAVLVYDGSKMTEYLNGKPGRSRIASGTLNSLTYLGMGRHHPGSEVLRAAVDDAMIFSRPLTPKEVVQLYALQGGK